MKKIKAKKLLSAFLAAFLLISAFVMPTSAKATSNDYLLEVIGELKRLGIFQGYPDGSMRENNHVTRAEMATVCTRLLDVDIATTTTSTGYSDVINSHWARAYIATTNNYGVTKGYSDGTFRPENDVTLDEALKMILVSGGYGLDNNGNVLSYPDGYIQTGKSLGVTDKISYEGNRAALRGEIMLMTYQMLQAGQTPEPDGDDYILKFDLNYNDPVGKIPDQTVKQGGYANRPTTEDVKRAGYLLTGWYTDKDYKKEFSFDTKINANITLYAKWIVYDDTIATYSEEFDYIADKLCEFDNMDKVVAYLQILLEQDKISDYENIIPNIASVMLKSGMTFQFMYEDDEIRSGGSDVQIKTYSPFESDIAMRIFGGIKNLRVQDFAYIFDEVFRSEGYSVDNNHYSDSRVDIATLKNMSGNIILWDGHGGYNSWYGSTLNTDVRKNDQTDEDYKTEISNSEITYSLSSDFKNAKKHYIITSKFIDALPDDCFKGALVYLNSCHSLQGSNIIDKRLAEAFRNRGASVVIGNTDFIQVAYSNWLFENIMGNLCKINPNTNHFYTVKEAIKDTFSKNYNFPDPSPGNATYYGNGDFRLTDLLTGIESMMLSKEFNDFLMGVTVTLYDVQNPTVPVISGTTDIMGIYRIYCSEGIYNIKFEKDGYETQTRYNIEIKKGNIKDIGNTWLVKSAEKEDINDTRNNTSGAVDIIVETVTGIESMVVSKEFNDFLMDVTVTLYDVQNPTVPVVSGTTDIMGIYKIYCSEGTYNIKFEKDGYETQTRYNIAIKKGNITDIGNTILTKLSEETGTNGGGKGDIPADAIHIQTAEELARIGGSKSAGKYYVLDNDINLTAEWVPINDFRGTFDGQGYSINNLYILKDSKKPYVGLFGAIGGGANVRDIDITIKNIALNIGEQGLTAYNVFQSVSSSATASAFAGGLIGVCSLSNDNKITIINAYVTGGNIYVYSYASTFGPFSASSASYAGGLIGYCICYTSSTVAIMNCYTTNDIYATSYDYESVGGLLGFCSCSSDSMIKIENSYVTGDVVTESDMWVDTRAGGLLSKHSYSAGTIEVNNCYCLSTQTIKGKTVDISGTPLTDAQMKDKSSFIGWDFDTVWDINPNINNGYPYLKMLANENNSGNNGGTNTSNGLEIQSTR